MARRTLISGFLALLLLSGSVTVFLALVATRPGATAKPPQERVWMVETTTAEPAAHQPMLRLYGRIESPSDAILTAAVEADVLSVAVREGQQVTQGEVLVTLDPRELSLQLIQREADVTELQAMIASEQTRFESDQRALEQEQTLLRLSRQGLQRATTLKKRKLSSDSALDEAHQALARQQLSLNSMRKAVDDHPARLAQLQAKLDRARALRDRSQLDLDRATITAPFAGRVAEVMVSAGVRVRNGGQLLQVYDTGALEVRAQIPAIHVTALQQGLRDHGQLQASATLDGTQLLLQLSRLAGRVEPGRGGVEGLFQLQPGELTPRLGRFIDLTLVLPPQRDTIALPGSAIYGTHRVYRVDDNRLRSITVERVGSLTRAGETLFLVRSSELSSGDQLLITQLANAIDGLQVEVAEGAPPISQATVAP